ncbi:TPA: glycosyltransferase family 2 protein, partial [Klebsiella pneumoniae]|nr:glycosyltransferase family 2 protein [Klebsiella pneumoniae]
MTVSVVIPTIGRDSVYSALKSVFSQTYKVSEIIICYDGDNFSEFQNGLDTFLELQTDNYNVSSINVGPFSGGNVARQKGVTYSSSEYIALLDDDDIWLPDHIDDYMKFIHSNRNKMILCSCCALINGDDFKNSVLPTRLINPGELISDYLFKVNGIKIDCGFIQSSLLLFSRELAIKIPFNQQLKFHQDIDWLLRVEQSEEKFEFYQSPEKTVVYNSTPLSVSKKIQPNKSCEWAVNTFNPNKKRCLGDFILTQSYHYARQNGTFKDEILLILKSFKYGKPGIYSLIRVLLKILRVDCFLANIKHAATT